MQLYTGHADHSLSHHRIDGNISVNSGAAWGQGSEVSEQLFTIGGRVTARDVTITDNYGYADLPSTTGAYWSNGATADVTMIGNYVAADLHYWHHSPANLNASRNTLIGSLGGGGNIPSTFMNETSGNMVIPNATGVDVFVRPNIYQPGRGHVVIYNWDLKSSVDVDLSTVFNDGDKYEIRHVYKLSDPPLISGTYNGGTVAIPMQATPAPALLGDTSPRFGLSIGPPVILSPEFGAFVLTTVAEPGAPILAASGFARNPVLSDPLTPDPLGPIVDLAIAEWTASGLSETQTALLEHVESQVADLSGARLGKATSHTIILDTNAAGYRWFIDDTPNRNEEFLRLADFEFQAIGGGAAAGRMDSLTVVMHELGHVLEYDHDDRNDDFGDLIEDFVDLLVGV